MLKDAGIPPMQFCEKNVREGASVFWMKSHRDNTPPVYHTKIFSSSKYRKKE